MVWLIMMCQNNNCKKQTTVGGNAHNGKDCKCAEASSVWETGTFYSLCSEAKTALKIKSIQRPTLKIFSSSFFIYELMDVNLEQKKSSEQQHDKNQQIRKNSKIARKQNVRKNVKF